MSDEDDDAAESILHDALPSKVITNFLTIYEYATETGLELAITSSETMTPWLASGMLNFAEDMIYSGAYGTSFDGEDDEYVEEEE